MKPDIVSVKLSKQSEEKTLEQSKSSLAANITIGHTKIDIHNGIDKYILFTLLKELKSNAH